MPLMASPPEFKRNYIPKSSKALFRWSFRPKKQSITFDATCDSRSISNLDVSLFMSLPMPIYVRAYSSSISKMCLHLARSIVLPLSFRLLEPLPQDTIRWSTVNVCLQNVRRRKPRGRCPRRPPIRHPQVILYPLPGKK